MTNEKLELLNLSDKELEIIARCIHFCSVTESLMDIIEPEEAEMVRQLDTRFTELYLRF